MGRGWPPGRRSPARPAPRPPRAGVHGNPGRLSTRRAALVADLDHGPRGDPRGGKRGPPAGYVASSPVSRPLVVVLIAGGDRVDAAQRGGRQNATPPKRRRNSRERQPGTTRSPAWRSRPGPWANSTGTGKPSSLPSRPRRLPVGSEHARRAAGRTVGTTQRPADAAHRHPDGQHHRDAHGESLVAGSADGRAVTDRPLTAASSTSWKVSDAPVVGLMEPNGGLVSYRPSATRGVFALDVDGSACVRLSRTA